MNIINKKDINLISNLTIAISSLIGVIGASGYYMNQATNLSNISIILLMFNLLILLLIIILLPLIAN